MPWASGSQTTLAELPAAAPSFDAPPEIESFFATGTLARVALRGVSGLPIPNVTYQWRSDGVDIAGVTSGTYEILSVDAGEVLSVVVTAANGEGTPASVTLNGQVVAIASGSQTYFPKLYTATGNILLAKSGTPLLLPDTSTQRSTVAMWWRQGDENSLLDFHSTDNRSQVDASGGLIRLYLTTSSGVAMGNLAFGPINPTEMAWYMIAIDTTVPVAEDRVKVLRRTVNSIYPPEKCPADQRQRAGHFERLFCVGTKHRDAGDYRVFEYRAHHRRLLAPAWRGLVACRFLRRERYPIDIDTICNPQIRIGGRWTCSTSTTG